VLLEIIHIFVNLND